MRIIAVALEHAKSNLKTCKATGRISKAFEGDCKTLLSVIREEVTEYQHDIKQTHKKKIKTS